MRHSIVEEPTTEKTRHFDVRIFPVLEAPHRCDLVMGLDIKECFFRYVLGDPEVRSKAVSALAIQPSLEWVFSRGMFPGTSGFHWPLILNDDASDPSGSDQPVEIIAAHAVLIRRYRSFLTLLQEIELTGRTASGDGQSISGSALLAPGHHFDAETGAVVALTGVGGQTRREVWKFLQIGQQERASPNDLPIEPAGRWMILKDLTRSEEAVFTTIKELYPRGLAHIVASVRNDKIAGRVTASDSTIKRTLGKVKFVSF
jgi:hypothetical protein